MHEEQKEQLVAQFRQLLENDNQKGLQELLAEQRTSDISEIVEILDSNNKEAVFELMDDATGAEVLEKVDEATRNELFEIFDRKQLAKLVSELSADDAADVLSEMEEEQSEKVLNNISPYDAYQIRKLMKYDKDSAGGIMDPILVSVYEDATVSEAIDKIRGEEIDEDFYSVFVINRLGQFLGDVRLRALITSSADMQIKQLVDTDTIFVRVDADQEEVRNIFKKNDLIVMPVLDENNQLVGRITADRVIEVAEEEAAEDVYTMAGTDATELENISIFHAARVRMTWLLPCLIGTAVTAIVMIVFEKKFHRIEDLAVFYGTVAAFVPMVAAISGNAGLQTSAIVVTGLATGDLAALRLFQVFSREVRVAALVALFCAIIGGLICGFLITSNILAGAFGGSGAGNIGMVSHLRIASAFGLAMFSAIIVATTLGLFLPFLFRKINIDPAIASGPLVTTANDSISVAIYLSLTLALVG